MDFVCSNREDKFYVEVTNISKKAMSNATHLPEDPPNGSYASPFRLPNWKIFSKTVNKVKQISSQSGFPTVLAITTFHYYQFLAGDAHEMFTGETSIAVPIYPSIKNPRTITTGKSSVFWKINEEGSVEILRSNISAILLININYDNCGVWGMLHPQPTVEFPIQHFPSVPFLRYKCWPPQEGKIETEWVIHKPDTEKFYHSKVHIQDEEIRA